MSSKLAVIGIITSIQPIEGADFIRQATVDCADAGAWSGVVGLEISQDDLVTVFLQDALLPPNERWDFMAKHKYRVRMARFKGVPSECVIISGVPDMSYPGLDLSAALGVTKYSKPLPPALAGDAVGSFPSFIPKTDEPNFQTVPKLVIRMDIDPWVATIKCDGTSCTVWNDDDGAMHVASRNLELKEFNATGAGNTYWRAARLYDMTKIPADCALQFEIVGPGIQGNPLGLANVEGRGFTLHDFKSHKRLGYGALADVLLAVGMPPAEAFVTGSGGMSHDALRRFAEIKYPNGKPGEGLVIRALDSSWSFKVLNLLYKD